MIKNKDEEANLLEHVPTINIPVVVDTTPYTMPNALQYPQLMGMKWTEAMEYYDRGRRLGIFCINDIRAAYHLPPVEGGEIYCVETSMGFIPLTKLEECATLNR